MNPVGDKTKTPEVSQKRRIPEAVEQEILAAIRGLNYGAVEVVVHDGQVVQIERKEKRRYSGEGS